MGRWSLLLIVSLASFLTPFAGSSVNIVIPVVGVEVYGYDVDPGKTIDDLESIPGRIDYLHIAIPYTNKFVDLVVGCIKRFHPNIVIIHSTVAPRTTRKVYESSEIVTAYSPVRGGFTVP